jgi:predicted negative regulator of RcsB-dependent stress response
VLTAKKKIAVREIATKSKYVEYWETLREFYERYRKPIVWGAGALLVLVVLGYIYQTNRKAKEEEASIALRSVQQLVQQGLHKMAIDGDPTQKVKGLKAIVSEYGGTPSGDIAAVLLGNAYLATDQFDLAFQTFDDVSPSGDLLKSAATAGKASALEAKKNFADAPDLYRKAAGAYENEFLTAARYFSAGRAYCLCGKKAEAKEMFDKVKEATTPRYDADIKRLTAQYGLEATN